MFTTKSNYGDESLTPCVDTVMVMNEFEAESHTLSQTRLQEAAPFVYRHINGLVLNLNSIIKDDYFPGSRNTHLVGQLK